MYTINRKWVNYPLVIDILIKNINNVFEAFNLLTNLQRGCNTFQRFYN